MNAAVAGRLRWAAKKTARKSLALAARGGGLLPAPGPFCRVLTYHRFADAVRDPFAVTPARFREQMAYLAERNLAVSLAQVEDHVGGARPLPRGAVLVTIDDGVQSVYEHALPALRDYALPAVAYVTPSLIGVGRDGAAVDGPEPYMRWDELEKLAEHGVSVQSHGWSHRSLGGRSRAEVDDEVGRSRAVLEQRLGRAVRSFAYPFGTRADFDDAAAAALARAGYRSAFTSQHGPVRVGDDPLKLSRVKVEGGEALWMFRLLVDGGLDPWRLIDQTLWRLQARRG